MEIDRWRLRFIAREAVLNVGSTRSRLFPMLAITVVLGTAMSCYLAVEGTAFSDSLDRLREQGRTVVVFQSVDPDDPVAINTATCESISTRPDVVRAGAILPGERADILPLGSRIPTYRVSTTLVPELRGTDAVIGATLSHRSAGALQQLKISGDVFDGVVGARQPEGIGVNAVVAFPLLPTDATSPVCIVEFEDFAARDAAVPSVAAELRSRGQPIAGVAVLRETVDVVDVYLHRMSALLAVALGVLAGGTIGVGLLLRSAEIAVYRLSGSARTSVLGILALECSLLAAAGGAAGTLTAVLLWPWMVSPLATVSSTMVFTATTALTSSTFAWIVVRRPPSDLAKDR